MSKRLSWIELFDAAEWTESVDLVLTAEIGFIGCTAVPEEV